MRYESRPPDELQQMAGLLAALAHPLRLAIVQRLLDGRGCVGSVVDCLGAPQPLVSRHLAILRRAGVVEVQPSGRKREYRVVSPCAEALINCLSRSWSSHPNTKKDTTRRSP